MKDDKSGFWKAICKDPDDDVPRLVFADYLDEQGQPERAELIRAQCDVEALPLSDPQRIDREMTAERLLRQNRFEWVEELPKWIQRSTVIFRRGFPYSIWATPSEYARSCSSLAKSTVIQQVDGFSNPFTDAHREKIEKSGHLPRVRGYARPQATRPELEWMLTHATGLKELSLFSPRGHGSDPSWLGELFHSESLRQIGRLHLASGPEHGMTDADLMSHLADAPMTALRALVIQRPSSTVPVETTLLSGSLASQLESLTFQLPLHDSVPESLTGLQSLRHLEMRLNRNSDQLSHLATPGALPKLCRWTIHGIDDDSAEHLGQTPMLEQLLDLDLPLVEGGPLLTSQGARGLLASGRFKNLRRLRLDGSDAKQTLEVIASSPLPKLRHLILASHRPEVEELHTLANSEGLPELQTVTIWEPDYETFVTRRDEMQSHFLLVNRYVVRAHPSG